MIFIRFPDEQAHGKKTKIIRRLELFLENCTLKPKEIFKTSKNLLSRDNKKPKRKKAEEETERCATLCARRGQAKKSTGRMPWHQEPKKDVTSCEKLRGGANIQRSADIRMGKPGRENPGHHAVNT